MQSIKICPKCNQAITDINNIFCPFDGTALIEMQPTQNPQPTPSESQVSQPFSALSPKFNWRQHKFILFVLFPMLACVGSNLILNKHTNKENSAVNISSPNSSAPAPSPTVELSSKEKLEKGTKDYNEGYFDGAKSYLSGITTSDREYKDAQLILNKIKNKEAILDKQKREESRKKADEVYKRMKDNLGLQ